MTRSKTPEAHTVYVERRIEDKMQTGIRRAQRAFKRAGR